MPNPLNKVVDAAGDAVRKILAYHGSPHSFDKFDASKIGTGEGGQAFGHGLYFAESPDVAEHYRASITGDMQETPVDYANRVWRYIASLPENAAESPEAVREKTISALAEAASRPGNSPSLGDAASKYLYGQTGTPPPPVRRGSVYEVEIAHPESNFLDLNSRVWTQPRRVQDALKSLIGNSSVDMGGKKAYSEVSRAYGDGLSDVAASKVLLDEGVPGIKYKDRMSRNSTANATRNYVMFPGTEDSISILRKYGLLPVVGAGAAAMSQNPAQTSE